MKGSNAWLRSLIFLSLAVISYSASALYIGNPNRPNTTWVPGCYVNGCWHDGYYLKFVNPPVDPREVVWVQPQNHRQGHWMPVNYVIVNTDM